MLEQYGQQIMTKPDGMLRPIHFPAMATMDKRTGDGRLLHRAGRGVRELPRTIFFQKAQAPGHEGSVPVGRVDAVQFHDDGNVEGWGWIIDTEEGRNAALHIAAQVQFHNSVDLAETKAKLDISENDDGELELLIDFTQWAIAATTIVGKPAFADAYAELSEEEITACLTDDSPLEVHVESFTVRVDVEEFVASAALAVPKGDFHVPEPNTLQKITVDGEGLVTGHLGPWDVYVDGKRIPRPLDNYASFNQPGPLAEDGTHIETGPIFFQGGHPLRPLSGRSAYEAYGGVENAWCDVRVIEGKLGPWLSGRVRPGVSDEVIYAARASRISGHWVGSELRAIVSVNVPRFNVGGSGLAAVDLSDGLELVASWSSEPDEEESTVDGMLAAIDEYVDEIGESLGVAELAVDTTPTTEMAAEAERGLAWRREFGRGGGSVAVARARDIKNRKVLTERTLRRMVAFFQRHEADKNDAGWSPGEPTFPSAARINWALWGGDAGYGWAKGTLAALENEQHSLALRQRRLSVSLALLPDD